MVSVRVAVGVDVAAVELVVTEAFGHYVARLGRPPAPMTADYRALVGAGQVWVAIEDGTGPGAGGPAGPGAVVGVMVLEPAPEHLYLETIAVRPQTQGRGVGARLLQLAESQAARLGLAAVVLCTNEMMTENLAYYPRRGYRLTHHQEQHGFRRVFFRKDVPAVRATESVNPAGPVVG